MQSLKEQFKVKEEEWGKEKNELHERINKIEKRLEKEERAKRRNNIIIWGEVTNSLNPENVTKYLKTNLNLGKEMEFQEVYTIRKGEKNAGIAVKCKSWEDKKEIMKKKSAFKGKKIFIENDMTPEERDIQRKIREKAVEEQKTGKEVKVAYQKLIIDGVLYKWNERDNKLEAGFHPSTTKA